MFRIKTKKQQRNKETNLPHKFFTRSVLAKTRHHHVMSEKYKNDDGILQTCNGNINLKTFFS
jgi:hypothetical protein